MQTFRTLFAIAVSLQASMAFAQFIVAHRGASFDAPENTMAAFRLAWEQQADAIEADFYLTADQKIVCIHDKSTKRTGENQRDLDVAKSTLEQLRGVDVGSWKDKKYAGEKIPTLQEVLAVVPPGKKIFVEIKCGPEIVPFLKPVLESSGLLPEQITIICFNEEVIRAARKAMPRYKANWLASFKQDKVTQAWSPTKEEQIKRLRGTGATGMGANGNQELADESFVKAVLDLGIEFHAWTINDVEVAKKLLKFGAYSITTDKPAVIRAGVANLLSQNRSVPYSVERTILRKGYDGKLCWVHARPGVIPASIEATKSYSPPTESPKVVVTTQQLDTSGSDTFHAIHSTSSFDLGKTWKELVNQPGFERVRIADGVEETICDFSSLWHPATKKLLGVGQTVQYTDNKVIKDRPRQTAYSVYYADKDRWSPPQRLEIPNDPKFYNSGAGSVQWCNLADGRVLLPIYFRAKEDTSYSVTVCVCSFDGKTLRYQSHGTELQLDVDRGLAEPSLTQFGNRFYLTLRNDQHGYLTSSSDGTNFDPIQRWKFDDGSDLGNYNTQQHWVSSKDKLYLVYTRQGALNDHIFRHRAPLFMAQVDTNRLCILRDTETVLIPERGARLGNFGVARISDEETWVVACEWMQSWKARGIIIPPDNAWGADNSIHIAKIKWNATGR